MGHYLDTVKQFQFLMGHHLDTVMQFQNKMFKSIKMFYLKQLVCKQDNLVFCWQAMGKVHCSSAVTVRLL